MTKLSNEIQACIADVKFRMDWARIPYEEGDILVLWHGDNVYILANPILGSEPIYDEFGRVVDHVPLHNITLLWQEDWLKSHVNYDSDCVIFEIVCPRLRVLRPEFCVRLGSTGEVVGELQCVIEEEEVRWQTEYFNREYSDSVQTEK